MDKRNKKSELLGSLPVPKALLAMGLPAMIGMMINAVYNLADAYFVGGLGTSQMAAIAVAFPLGQVIVGLGLLFGNGAASYISRLLGNNDNETADKTASTALYSSVFVGAAIIIVVVIFLKPVLKVLGATESIMPYALTYTGIYIVSSIFNVFNVTMNNIVTSEGAAKTTMCALLAGAVLNIILDPIFIYCFKLGVAGAAVATGISQLVSTMVYLRYIHSKKSIFSFSIKKCCFSNEIIYEILKIGIPTLTFQLLTSVSISLTNMQAKLYGDYAIAAMGAAARIISMGSLVVFGFTKGFQPIAGYSYGAKKYERLNEAVKVSIILTTLFCTLYGSAAAIFSEEIISQFTKGDIQMIAVGQRALLFNGISFILFGFYTVYSSLFLALGKAGDGFILGSCRQGICFIPIIFILPEIFGINGIIYAQPVSDILSAVLAAIMALNLHKNIMTEKSSFSL
ncbi:MATE family efflux transporter [Lachnospiraceae bacterium NSJ-143]|nr:MATE family efflux transporter [Lachnospiraceae bacterium NSJ-143]